MFLKGNVFVTPATQPSGWTQGVRSRVTLLKSPLTGLQNRRFLDELLNSKLQKRNARTAHFPCLMLELDQHETRDLVRTLRA